MAHSRPAQRKPARESLTAAEFDKAFERGMGFAVLDVQRVTVQQPMMGKRAKRNRRGLRR